MVTLNLSGLHMVGARMLKPGEKVGEKKWKHEKAMIIIQQNKIYFQGQQAGTQNL